MDNRGVGAFGALDPDAEPFAISVPIALRAELDTASRTLRVEVDIPNGDRALVSGMYARASFDVKRQDAPIFVPATSVVIDAAGTRVAVVKDGSVRWQKVEVTADLGDRLALATGLSEGETVALTPSARLREGQRVTARAVP